MRAREEGLKQRHLEKSYISKPAREVTEHEKADLTITKSDQLMLLVLNPFLFFLFLSVFVIGVILGAVFF